MESNKEEIKVLTLNCWGIVPVAVKKQERFDAIRKTLLEGEYDIICLQEVWAEKDFQDLHNDLHSIYPYDNYFHSNYVGSGCCIFSKYKILETFFHRYSINGYAFMISHGDWFGGKGLGFAKIETKNKFILHVYVTHLHADYAENGLEDSYLPHRVAQSIEMMQFIRLTSIGCDGVILAGDMNSWPDSLVYRIMTNYGRLHDCYLSQTNIPESPEENGATCDRPDNSFVNTRLLVARPYGLRLDYLFFRSSSGTRISCQTCDLAMRKIPNSQLSYSDHEGVEASLIIQRDVLYMEENEPEESEYNLLNESLTVIDQGLSKNHGLRFHCFCGLTLLVGVILVLLIFIGAEAGYLERVYDVFLVVLGAIFFVLLWHTVINSAAERKAYLNNRQNINWLLAQFKEKIKRKSL